MHDPNQLPDHGLPKRAAQTASVVALFLVAVKVFVGFKTGSMMVIASAVDSGLDFLISVFNFMAVKKAAEPSNEKFNYGHGKLEALASAMEGLVIMASGAFILTESAAKLINGEVVQSTRPAIVVMALSAVVTLVLVRYLNGVARKTQNMVIEADALHYKTDLYANVGILVALFLIQLTGWSMIDPLISIAIALHIGHAAYKLIREGVMMLLDRALPKELTQAITQILDDNREINSWHLLRTRTSSNINFVDVHLVFDRQISLLDAHRATEKIEKKIRALDQATWVINCHMDPIDDSHHDPVI